MAKRRGFFRGVSTVNWTALSKAAPPFQKRQPDEGGEGGDVDDPDDAGNGDGNTSADGADELSDDTGDAPDVSDEQMPQSPMSAVHGGADPRAAALKQKVPEDLKDIAEARNDPQSLFWDPYAVIDALGYKDRPSPMTYATLRAMVWRMPIVQLAIKTRLDQVSSFAVPQVDKYSTGYRVVQRDKKAKPTPASEARSQQIERWLLTTGVTEHAENRDDFETFLVKIARDSLTFDQMAFEIVPSREDLPAEFYAVDASTIRIADTTRLFVDPEDENVVRYVQIYDGLVVAEFTSNQLCFGVRNPATDIRLQGYGQSELEMLVSTITSLLWAWDYNQKFFSQGATTKGIINFQGTVPENRLRAFRRHWYSMVAGVENAWRTPIMASDGLQWVDIQKSNKDMEFNAWMDFLIKIVAGMYAMDPMEFNFKYGDAGAKPMFESANQSKLSASKDKGLKPLLRFLQRKISTHLVSKLDPDFEFEFVGLDSMTPNEQADLNAKLVKSTRTVDELRALEDLPPLANGMGDIILDPVYFQHMQGAAQQQAGVGDFAEPPPPPEPGDDDPFSKLKDDLDSGGDDEGGGDKPKPPEPTEKSRRRLPVIPARPTLLQKSRFTIDIDV